MSTQLQPNSMQDTISQRQAEFNAAFDALAKSKFNDKDLAAKVLALFGKINTTPALTAN